MTTTMQMVAIEEIAESPHNPRRTYDAAALEDLADSIREQGVLEPLLVRRRPSDPRPPGVFFPFELVAGHRRLRGARKAGLREVPCIVRDLDDAQALEAALVENGHREDVTPLDEATAFARLRELGREVHDIADRIGRAPGYVRSRLRLLDLVPEVRALLAAGRIHVGSALLLAQVSEDEQREAAETIGNDRSYRPARRRGEPWTTSDVADLLRDRSRRVSLAIWSLDDADLVAEAGACTTCPKRTGSQRALLAEMEGEDQCLDGACWSSKIAASLTVMRERGDLVLEGDDVTRAEDSGAHMPLDTEVHEDDFPEVYETVGGETVLTWEDALAHIDASVSEWTTVADGRMTGGPRVERWVSAGHLADLVADRWPQAAHLLRLRKRDWERPAQDSGARSEQEADAEERDEVESQAHAEEERERAEQIRRAREKHEREKRIEDMARAAMMRELVSYAEADGVERLAWWVALARVVLSTVSAEACLSMQRRRSVPLISAPPSTTAWDHAHRALDAWLVTATSVGEVRGAIVELLAHAGLHSSFLFVEDDPNGAAGPYKILPLLRETRGDDDAPGIEPGAALRHAKKALADQEHAAKHAAKKAADKATKKKVASAKKAREVRDGA